MPFYEYVCGHCGATLEKLQKLSDPPATECPSCHRHALTKVVSAAGFRLKGGGWYETDFKSSNKKNIAGAEGGGDAAKPAVTGGGGESKPAAAPVAAPSPAPVKSSGDA